MSARADILAGLTAEGTVGDLTPEELVDAHRDEALAADGQAYPGELAMLRTLVRTLRTAAREDNGLPEVRRLLVSHAADDGALRAARADGPDRVSTREARLAQLLDAIRTWGGRWSSGSVQQLRRATGGPVQRGTARRDLIELTRRGHLAQHGPADGRYYTLKTRKDGRP
ncbi:hypothetical protein ABZ650_20345 [Streptomyces griseoviridis]|uniref:hypothetical protein n=1 Tax=Streptomyces griseoviridis TaxID=45398 RepID=UPI00340EEAFE